MQEFGLPLSQPQTTGKEAYSVIKSSSISAKSHLIVTFSLQIFVEPCQAFFGLILQVRRGYGGTGRGNAKIL